MRLLHRSISLRSFFTLHREPPSRLPHDNRTQDTQQWSWAWRGRKSSCYQLQSFCFLILIKCLTCLKWLAVEHAPFFLPISEVDLLGATAFASEVKVFSLCAERVEHVFAGGAKEHTKQLKVIIVLLQRNASVIRLIIVLLKLFLWNLLFNIGLADIPWELFAHL